MPSILTVWDRHPSVFFSYQDSWTAPWSVSEQNLWSPSSEAATQPPDYWPHRPSLTSFSWSSCVRSSKLCSCRNRFQSGQNKILLTDNIPHAPPSCPALISFHGAAASYFGMRQLLQPFWGFGIINGSLRKVKAGDNLLCLCVCVCLSASNRTNFNKTCRK